MNECSDFLSLFYSKYTGKRAQSGKIYADRKRYRGAGHIGVVEIGTFNTNLHMHAIVYGPIVPVERLRAAWEEITNDSFGVHIQRINSPQQSVAYISKYIGKPPVIDSYDDVARYALMLKGSRRIKTGGIFYNRIKLPPLPSPVCPYCGSRMSFERSPQYLGSRAVHPYKSFREPGSVSLSWYQLWTQTSGSTL